MNWVCHAASSVLNDCRCLQYNLSHSPFRPHIMWGREDGLKPSIKLQVRAPPSEQQIIGQSDSDFLFLGPFCCKEKFGMFGQNLKRPCHQPKKLQVKVQKKQVRTCIVSFPKHWFLDLQCFSELISKVDFFRKSQFPCTAPFLLACHSPLLVWKCLICLNDPATLLLSSLHNILCSGWGRSDMGCYRVLITSVTAEASDIQDGDFQQ